MSLETAFAPIIMKVAPTQAGGNDFQVTVITQAEPGFIPEGGYGMAYHRDSQPVVPAAPPAKAGSGSRNPAEAEAAAKAAAKAAKDSLARKITCRVFVTDKPVAVGGGKPDAHKVGLAIDVANGKAKIGPIFGYVSDKTEDSKVMKVKVNAGEFLDGFVDITFVKLGPSKEGLNDKVPSLSIKGNFNGILSGFTEFDTVVPNPKTGL
ncbi:hypothetical protein QBC34DRAFT_430280 [Podospora aff. communis PSN243]|uniref:Uncharacterized protein n=1 Tax=Podospora aff. communis PSN243 TaxID=3040156 RepID=A0AAV9GA84_9PEZI|nr:hypothetical protein QBC34DRAFT_430280 [Podospora aff. communis PSN243]